MFTFFIISINFYIYENIFENISTNNSPNVTAVLIIANGIPTIGMNDNPISAPANNIAI